MFDMQPPALTKIYDIYCADPKSKHLRFGQWFINTYMPKQQDCKLYSSTILIESLMMIGDYYVQYQWEI